MTSLSGRHAVVTGASRGIGAAIARALDEAGASLSLFGRDRDALDARAGELQDARAIVCDICDDAAVARAFAEARDAFGPVAILVNNAGIAESAALESSELARLEAMWKVNVAGTYACTKEAIFDMREQGSGRVINIASTAALRGYAYVGAYVATKHAVAGLTRAWALEYARSGITVNAVCPGYTETDLLERSLDKIEATTKLSRDEARARLIAHNPQGRMIQPEEIAHTVRFLCEDASSSITGHCLPVSGGEC